MRHDNKTKTRSRAAIREATFPRSSSDSAPETESVGRKRNKQKTNPRIPPKLQKTPKEYDLKPSILKTPRRTESYRAQRRRENQLINRGRDSRLTQMLDVQMR